MKFSLGMPTDRVKLADEFVTGEAVMEIAAAAESAGFDNVSVTEHPFPEDEWMRTGGHHALDPFVALSFAAAATTRLRLQTNLVVVPYRNPFLCAKSVASLDRLSRGRFVFGVGAGYLAPEFEALGVDFSNRNELTDEYLQAMKRAWSEEGITAKGSGYAAEGHTAKPNPDQMPHPPIWIGGNSKRAIRRAVELADGWMPMVTPEKFSARRRSPALESLDELAGRLAYAREHAGAVGRTTPLDVTFMPLVPGFGHPAYDRGAFLDHIAAQAELGVTTLQTRVEADTRKDLLERIAAYGEDLAEVSQTTF